MTLPKEEIHWHHTAIARRDYSALKGDTSADVIVVGGGLTGCRTALGLSEAGKSVVLIEQNDIGFGASGRSGGQCNPMWRQTPDDLAEQLGETYAENLVNTTLNAAKDLFDDIARFDVACDPEQNGWVQAAHTRSSRKSLARLASGWRAAGAEIDAVEGTDVETLSGSPAYRFALFHRQGGHVQPLSLTRGYAAAAMERGARIHCGEAVASLESRSGNWTVHTASGSVTAPQVVLTTNAYTPKSLWPGLSQTFFPLISISIATAPLTPAQQATVLPNRVTIADTRLAIYYSRYDRENRLIFGCVGSTENVGTLGGHARLRTGMHTVFPQLKGIGIERTWGGRIAVTPEMMPHLHEPAPGITAGLGFSGRGIAMTSVMGRTLTRKLLGDDPESLAFPVLPLSPIALHTPLAAMVPFAAPAMSAKDKLDSALSGL